MKAQFFNKPLNYTLNIEGEAWEQGSTLNGELALSYTTADKVDFTKVGVHLCYCQNKKLKAKDVSGIKIIESIHLVNEKEKLPFNFSLDSSCPITDKTGSLQLFCGNITDPFNCGIVELKIIPTRVISQFIEVFELFYRFKFKTLKNKNTYIESQVIPPATKEWAKIQKINLEMKMKDNDLIVNCLFKIKTLSFENSITSTKDEKREIRLSIPGKDHSLYGAVNQEGIKKHISHALEQVKLKSLI